MHRLPRTLPITALALTGALACSGTAIGHAVVTLGGKTAKAGGSGNLSLKIEHGCSGGLATNRVVAWFSSDWRSIRPTGPADANHESPANFPVPRIRVSPG